MFLSGNFALKPLQIGEIMLNNKIMHFRTFTGTQMRKKPTRKRPYFTMESAMTALLRVRLEKCIMGYYSIVVRLVVLAYNPLVFSEILVLLHPTSGYSEIHFYFEIHSEIEVI